MNLLHDNDIFGGSSFHFVETFRLVSLMFSKSGVSEKLIQEWYRSVACSFEDDDSIMKKKDDYKLTCKQILVSLGI